MMRAAGGENSDSEVTFGQIVAVTIFSPVLVEMVYVIRNRRMIDNGIGDRSTQLPVVH
jgi:hypothetical protein